MPSNARVPGSGKATTTGDWTGVSMGRVEPFCPGAVDGSAGPCGLPGASTAGMGGGKPRKGGGLPKSVKGLRLK